MVHLTHGVGLVLEVGLAVFCFVDVLISDEAAVRVLPRWGWVVAILVFPLLGAVGYLLAGRGWRASRRPPAGAGTVAAGATAAPRRPDGASAGPAGAPVVDPGLLEALRRVDDEHEAMLARWEDDLRAREARLRAAERAGQHGPADPLIGGPAAA